MNDTQFDHLFHEHFKDHVAPVPAGLWEHVVEGQFDQFVGQQLKDHTAPLPDGLWERIADANFDASIADQLANTVSPVSDGLWDRIVDANFDNHFSNQFNEASVAIPKGLWEKVNPQKEDDDERFIFGFLKKPMAAILILGFLAGAAGIFYAWERQAETSQKNSQTNTQSNTQPNSQTNSQTNAQSETGIGVAKGTTIGAANETTTGAASGNNNNGNNNTDISTNANNKNSKQDLSGTDIKESGSKEDNSIKLNNSKNLSPLKPNNSLVAIDRVSQSNLPPKTTNTNAQGANSRHQPTNQSQQIGNTIQQTGTNVQQPVNTNQQSVIAKTPQSPLVPLEEELTSSRLLTGIPFLTLGKKAPAQSLLVNKTLPTLSHTNQFKNIVVCPTGPRSISSEWHLETYGAADMGFKSVTNVSASASHLSKKDSSESNRLSYSAGLRLVKPLSENLLLKAGIQYGQLNQKYVYRIENEVKITQVISIRTIIRAPGDTIIVRDTSLVQTIGFRNNTVFNRYRSIDVPITIGYQFGKEDLKIGLNAGVVFNLNSWYQGVVLDSSLATVPLNKTGNEVYKTKIGMGLVGSISIVKKIKEGMHVFIEPHIRYNFSNMTTPQNPYQQKFTVGGLAAGLRMNLNKP